MSITAQHSQYAGAADPLEEMDWAITYEDGEAIIDCQATGKLSLDGTWALVLRDRAVVLAVPAHRIIEVRRAGHQAAKAA